jgi:uncharacterized protein (DUF1501 family)
MSPHSATPRFVGVSRRDFFGRAGSSLGALALSALLARDASSGTEPASDDPLQPRRPHFAPRARHVIYLHMIGAPSQLDLFDHKPVLDRFHGQPCPPELTRGRRFAFIGSDLTLAASPFRFAQHGQSGQRISELLPHLATVADDIAIVRSLHTDEINHAPAQMFLHTGSGRGGRPGLGAWMTYGLGTENHDFPAYVVLLSGVLGGAGNELWSHGFLPGAYQGVPLRSAGDPVLFLSNPPGHASSDRRRVLDAVRSLNEIAYTEAGDPEIVTRIGQYEMAYRMQASVPELMEIAGESTETLALYGATPGKPSFANNCLLARRLVERGVRIVELYDSDWDHHNNLTDRLKAKCKDVDQGMSALIKDLKRRGLLDDTLVIWGGEFGRTPLRQTANANDETTTPGRDHHKDAFTMWLAGGGIRPGIVHGTTDELGFNITENPVHVHDLNATALHLLGIDHERLTFRSQGRDFRLTDVHGRVVKNIIA